VSALRRVRVEGTVTHLEQVDDLLERMYRLVLAMMCSLLAQYNNCVANHVLVPEPCIHGPLRDRRS
jgi:hypothetical protein